MQCGSAVQSSDPAPGRITEVGELRRHGTILILQEVSLTYIFAVGR